jgi:lactoylglutathione lyase
MPKRALSSIVVPVQNVTAVVPLLMVTNMERSLAFYVDGLGFTIQNRWVPDGRLRRCWMSLGGAALMLQEASDSSRKKMTAAGVLGNGVSLNVSCGDAIAIYRDAATRDIHTLREPQVGNLSWEVVFADPDGYSIHFSSPTDLPEETRLADVRA